MRTIGVSPLLLCVLAAQPQAQGVRVEDLGGLFQAIGVGVGGGSAVRVPQSNTFLLVTSEGSLVIDTSFTTAAPAHRQALAAVAKDPIRAVVLTHAHGDHTGGVGVWRQAGTQVTALYLTDMALAADPAHTASLEARLKALGALDAKSDNSNERGWLAAAIRDAERKLKAR